MGCSVTLREITVKVVIVRLVIVIDIVIIQIVCDVILVNQIDLFDFKILPLDFSRAFVFCPRETNAAVILSNTSITTNIIVIVSFSVLSK